MFQIKIIITLLGIAAYWRLTCAARVNYDGYSVVRCVPVTSGQLDYLKALQSKSETMSDIDFWTPSIDVNRTVDIMAGPAQADSLIDWLERNSILNEIMIADVGRSVMLTMPKISTRLLSHSSLRPELLSSKNFYRQYQRYEVIEAKLRSIQEMDPRVSLETIGKSFEGRNLYLVKVSSDPSVKKPIILIDAGHHAREWISHATLVYLLESLVNIDVPKITSPECKLSSCREAVKTITKLDLNSFDYWFVPVVNPDGYEYSHTSDRLWRKTRSRDILGAYNPCIGVDPNRNYDIKWGMSGANPFPCAQTYPGRRAFSEPETKALASVMENSADKIIMYVSLHAFSQMILTPYGYTRKYPEQWGDIEQVVKVAKEKLYALRNTDYIYGPAAIVLYSAAGSSDDYAYDKGIKYSMTIELPDKGKNGFLLPPEEIIPVGHEALIALRAMTDKILEVENISATGSGKEIIER